MALYVKNKQTGFATIASGSVTSASITQVNHSKTFLIFTEKSNNNSPLSFLIRGYVSDSGKHVVFDRMGTSTTVVIYYELLEFTEDSDINIQRGRGRYVHGNSININSVSALNYAFATFCSNQSGSGYGNDDNGFIDIVSATSIVVKKRLNTTGTSASDIAWQVVASPHFNVQKIRDTVNTSGTEQYNLNYADINSSFILAYQVATLGTLFANGINRFYFLNSNKMKRDAYTGSVQSDVYSYVVNIDPNEVRTYQYLDSMGDNVRSKSTTINSVNPKYSLIIPGNAGANFLAPANVGNNLAANAAHTYQYLNSTTISADRLRPTGCSATMYSLTTTEFPSIKVNVFSASTYLVNPSTSSTINWNVSSGANNVYTVIKNLNKPTPIRLSTEIKPTGYIPFNLSKRRVAVSASSVRSGFEAISATDENTNTRWSSQFSDPQYWWMDLGNVYPLGRIEINWHNEFATDFNISASTNGNLWRQIHTETLKSTSANTIHNYWTSGIDVRYLKFHGIQRNTTSGYSFYEFKVFESSGGYMATSAYNYGLKGSIQTSQVNNYTLIAHNGFNAEISANIKSYKDDGAENVSNGYNWNNNNYIDFGYESPATSAKINGALRFSGIKIPKYSYIIDSYIKFEANEASSGAPNLTIWAQSATNTSQFSEGNIDSNITNRTKTINKVTWNPTNWTKNGIYKTPSLTSLVQEVINLPSWTSGTSDLTFIFSAQSFSDTPKPRVRVNSFGTINNSNTGKSPAQLYVYYANGPYRLSNTLNFSTYQTSANNIEIIYFKPYLYGMDNMQIYGIQY